ncbi:MAG: phytoene/squalene synthase family protein [Flavobacteriales bacterium]|nr:phytoene/squalene synthase family protein [Flavobacteriales bacterium]
MMSLYDSVSMQCSKRITRAYSTSFSLGISTLSKRFHDPIYAIYGFVRLADEIVDTFHDYDKKVLLDRFRNDTIQAIEEKISLNPVLHCFQQTVHRFEIDWALIEGFLDSMQMDLEKKNYDSGGYQEYIYGSAEVVGLMCLRVFTEKNKIEYEELKPFAMKLGSAFQKVNFLRDLRSDTQELGRNYFPQYQGFETSMDWKESIEKEIKEEFHEAWNGIRNLPRGAKLGVYIAYKYYTILFHKIQSLPAEKILQSRVRIPDRTKARILVVSCCKHYLRLI